MTASNIGPFSADTVTIRNSTIQMSESSLVITCAASGGATCPTTLGPMMTTPSMPSGGTLVFTVTGLTIEGATGTFSDTISISSDSTDYNSDNNTATATGTVVSNDVSVTATAPATPLVTGTATWTMLVSNAGPDDATAVSLVTQTSANLTFSPASITCVAAGGAKVPTLQSDGVTLVSALIPSAGSLTCSVPVTVAAGTNGTATVSMTATSVGDSKTGNNTGTAGVSTTLVGDLNVAGSGTPPTSVTGGGTATLSYVIGNAGPSTATDVSITETLTADLKLAGSVSCVPAGGAVAPTLQSDGKTLLSPAIPMNATLTCSVPVSVTAGSNASESVTLTVASLDDTHTGDNSAKIAFASVSSDLGVSQVGASQVGAGSPATFTATIANPGAQGVASNITIQWTHVAPSGVTFETPTCVAHNGATCPAVPAGATTVTVPTMAPGTNLVFTFVADTTTAARGAISNTVSISSAGDPNTANNTASTTTTAVNASNGSYSTFAADGNPYTLAIDFDKLSYTMTGGTAVPVTHAFTLDSSTGDYVASDNSNVRFRLNQGAIVGAHNFSSGVLPYIAIAGSNFITDVSGLNGGSYDLSTRNVSIGVATTHAGTATFSGNTLLVCQSNTLEVVQANNCDPADLVVYQNFTVNGNVFSASSTTNANDIYKFSIATIGSLKVLLSTGAASDGSQQFRIGLIDAAGFVANTLRGGSISPSATSNWLSVALTQGASPIYNATVGSTPFDTAGLTSIGGGINGMFTGTDSAYNAKIYVTESLPLAVVVGRYGTAASGLLELTSQ